MFPRQCICSSSGTWVSSFDIQLEDNLLRANISGQRALKRAVLRVVSINVGVVAHKCCEVIYDSKAVGFDMSSIGKNSKPNNLISPIKLVNTNITKSSHSSYIPINDNNNDNWQIQNSKTSKRNISSSSDPSVSSPTSHTTKTNKRAKPPFITANRFQVLSPNDAEVFSFPEQTEKQTTTQEEISSKPPPPIFMRGITEYNRLCLEFSQLIGKENFYCKSSADQLKIQTASPEAYRILVHHLKNNDALFHTFQLNQDKPIRAVIRNIHSSTTVDEIKKELTDLSFEVLQITQVLHKTTKLPLPLFFVDLPQSEKSSEIFKLTSLLYAKIKVEEPYKHRTIPQCLNCQDYGHTRAYYGYPARCVRCGAPHISSDCPKPRELPAKCALCAGDHPANYKGCTVFKELQRRKTPRSKSNLLHDNVNLNPDDNTDNVKMSHPLPPIHSKVKNNHQFPKSFAQATKNHQNHDQAHPSPPSDNNNVLTNFISQFETLINPLIALLTQLITSLLENKK
ncbi:hypothetical protein QTP88_019396 [Uroleucon formosanum]